MEKRYSCEDIAGMYGVKLRTVWDWVRSKRLSALKIGKRYYIRQEDIDAFEHSSKTT